MATKTRKQKKPSFQKQIKSSNSDIFEFKKYTMPADISTRIETQQSFFYEHVTDQFKLSNWQAGAILTAMGLSLWQSILCIVVGKLAVATVTILTSKIGDDWHIGYYAISIVNWG